MASSSFNNSSTQFSSSSQGPSTQKGSSSYRTHEYTNVDDILTQGQTVTCVFEKPVAGFGFIDPSSDSPDVAVGTKIELPIWLAKVLRARRVITVEVPKGFNETYREILDADPSVVDLHNLGPNYYKLGGHLVDLDLKDSGDIAKSLSSTFHRRFHKLFDYSIHGSHDTASEMNDFMSKLDNMEKEILKVGRDSTEQFKQWNDRSCEKITANAMVSAYNKKKQVEMQVAMGGSSR